jgi:fructose-bisphosphate aldolase, class I
MVTIQQLSSDVRRNVAAAVKIDTIAHQSNMGRARAAELYNMFYNHGPGNGTMLSLPFDQLVEHGVGHVLKWERSADPRAVIELANMGKFSALALSLGQAEKYQNLINLNVPLIVKVDGHFLVGNDVQNNRHSMLGSVQRAVKCGANAIGLTFYFGGADLQEDVERVADIVEEAHEYGKPVFMWAYARGPLANKMGSGSLYWCAQGIAAAESLGVDVVKQKFPVPIVNKEEYVNTLSAGGYFHKKMPEIDQLLQLEPEDPANVPYDLHVKRLAFMRSVAPNTLKIISGGAKFEEPHKGLVETTRMVMDAGCEGRIVGRNFWGRPINEALPLIDSVVAVMKEEKYHRKIE